MLIPEAIYFVAGYWALVLLVALVVTYEWRTTRRLMRHSAAVEDLLDRAFAEDKTLFTRVEDVEKNIRQLCERQGQLALSGDGRPFDLAIDLVRRGAKAENLVTSFGLSSGEARLMQLMHGRGQDGDQAAS